MKQEGESQSYHRTIRDNMVTDENDVNLGRMKNTELTRQLADEERRNRDTDKIVGEPMSGEEANNATDKAAKVGMGYIEAKFIPDDPPQGQRGFDNFGEERRGRDNNIVQTTLRVADQYDELQQKAADISKKQLEPPVEPSTPADQQD